jgi:ATP phosphoribosyltransferase
MLVDSSRLHIAIQKSGRLSELSRGLLKDAGLRIQNGKNDLTARVENFPADLMFVRDDDIPTFVSDGICEFGMVGENVLQEFALGEGDARFEIVGASGLRTLQPSHRGAGSGGLSRPGEPARNADRNLLSVPRPELPRGAADRG